MSSLEFETIDDTSTISAAGLGARQPHLIVALEADRPSSRGARYSLAGVDEVIIGRGTERGAQRRFLSQRGSLRLSVPGRSMSSSHARLVRVGATWVLEDTESRNGTFINGTRISREALRDGAVAEMGHTFFLLRQAWPTPAEATMDVDSAELLAMPVGLRTLNPSLEQRHGALQRIAASAVPVLLLGPTGTGKELVARAVHDASKRTGAFVPVNCGALPALLVEGLLFGHMRGSFSGAVRDEPGFVRAADGGTLFLDEIGDLPLASQAVLLRVLQEGEVVPVGATRPVRVDLRVIAATHHPLERLAATGQFRTDLLGRLKGFSHVLDPLAERREDFGVILADLLDRLSPSGAEAITLAPRVARAFLQYAWPLNIRELAQCLSASVTLATTGLIGPQDLPAELSALASGVAPTHHPPVNASPPPQESGTPEDARLETSLVALLREHRGNVAAVARALGKAPMQVHRWMKRFNIDPNNFRA